MPSITLEPDTYVSLEYKIGEDDAVVIEITSDIPVKSYIVRPKGLELFKDGSTSFKYYGGFPDPRREQQQELLLPFSGPWYLIISNPSRTKTARVNYAVSS
jgi:hypothetical protein